MTIKKAVTKKSRDQKLREWCARLQVDLSRTQTLALQLQAAISSIQAELLAASHNWMDGKADNGGLEA